MPNRVFEEAGKLAGYYSSGRDSDKLEIDYLQKKKCKKTGRKCTRICRILYELLSHDSSGHQRPDTGGIIQYISFQHRLSA